MQRRILALSCAALLPGAASAQTPQPPSDYPSRPVRVIVPFTPGGASDILARVVARGLTERWRQSVVVENIPGASAIIGTDRAAKSPPDGTTILFGTISNLGVNPSLFEGRLPYDPLRSFAPITLAASIPLALCVNAALPATNLAEFVALARTRGDLTYGSGGNGSSQHLAMELVRQRAGVAMTHVPYRSSAPAMVDLVAGQIAAMFDNLNTALPHVASGRVRALAVTSAARAPQLPAVPTVAEAGFPEAQLGTWFAFLAPAGTPPEILARMHADTVEALRAPAARDALAEQGMEIIASTPDALTTHMREEIARWGAVVRAGDIRVD